MTALRTVLRNSAIGITAVALIPLLAGCWQGPAATTTVQATQNSGDGTQAQVGSIKVENATVVRGDDGRASLIMSLFNVGSEPDMLTGVTLNGNAVTLPGPDATALLPGSARSFGYGMEGQPPVNILLTQGLDVPASSYVPVTLTFERAGQLDISVLTVPPVGEYEGLLPLLGS
ncbi:MAG: hypothetical protein ACR2KE_01945 [Candidatus Nanopelagicales bacterium]